MDDPYKGALISERQRITTDLITAAQALGGLEADSEGYSRSAEKLRALLDQADLTLKIERHARLAQAAAPASAAPAQGRGGPVRGPQKTTPPAGPAKGPMRSVPAQTAAPAAGPGRGRRRVVPPSQGDAGQAGSAGEGAAEGGTGEGAATSGSEGTGAPLEQHQTGEAAGAQAGGANGSGIPI